MALRPPGPRALACSSWLLRGPPAGRLGGLAFGATHAVTTRATLPTAGGALVPARDGGDRRLFRLAVASGLSGQARRLDRILTYDFFFFAIVRKLERLGQLQPTGRPNLVEMLEWR